jgi:hypothetical protein
MIEQILKQDSIKTKCKDCHFLRETIGDCARFTDGHGNHPSKYSVRKKDEECEYFNQKVKLLTGEVINE